MTGTISSFNSQPRAFLVKGSIPSAVSLVKIEMFSEDKSVFSHELSGQGKAQIALPS